MGFIDTRAALAALREESEKRGAIFHYGCEVRKIDPAKQEVWARSTKDGEEMCFNYKKNVVVTTGPYTPNFKKEQNVEPIETETIQILDPTGLPPVAILYDDTHFYLLPYSPEKKAWKIGTHIRRSFVDLLDTMKKFFPSKLSCLGEVQPCFYTMRYPEKGLQIYSESTSIWGYGFCGHGFKHGPSIGIKVRNLVVGGMKPKL